MSTYLEELVAKLRTNAVIATVAVQEEDSISFQMIVAYNRSFDQADEHVKEQFGPTASVVAWITFEDMYTQSRRSFELEEALHNIDLFGDNG